MNLVPSLQFLRSLIDRQNTTSTQRMQEIETKVAVLEKAPAPGLTEEEIGTDEDFIAGFNEEVQGPR